MTDAPPQSARATRATRRTAILLVAWAAAGVAAGTPDDAASSANAESRATHVPVVNSGPECFAGHAPPASFTFGYAQEQEARAPASRRVAAR